MNTIHVCDNLLPAAKQEALMSYVNQSRFRIGWEDTSDISRSANRYLYSPFTPDEFAQTEFMQSITDARTLELVNGRTPTHVIVNLSVPSDVYFNHTHNNEDVLLYYVNTNWKEEWAGETLFFAEDRRSIIYASGYTPNRAIFFDGEVPHSIRPQSIAAPHYRFTLSVFFAKEGE